MALAAVLPVVDVKVSAGVVVDSSVLEDEDNRDEVKEIFLQRFIVLDALLSSVATSSPLETSMSFEVVVVVVPVVVAETFEEDEETNDDDATTSFGFVINFFNSFSQEAFLAMSLIRDLDGYP